MNKIFFTSDTHFFHQNILKYEPESRPFGSVEEMNEKIIENWNSVVGPEDTVYHLGDFFMGPAQNIEPTVKRLNGNIILVRGNHDTANRLEIYKSLGIEVKDIAYIPYKGRFFICCHFPIDNAEFIKMVRQDNSEVVFLYGHVHHNAPDGYVDGTYHVGMDTNNLTPINIDDLWKQCWPEEIMTKEVKEYKELHDKPKCATCLKSNKCFSLAYGQASTANIQDCSNYVGED